MSATPTVITAKITADNKELRAAFEQGRQEAIKMQREAERASAVTEAAQKRLGETATKTGNAVSGATSAVQSFASATDRSLTGLTKSLAGVAGLLGPTGAIAGGAAVATIALVEMFTRPQREAKQLKKDIEENLRLLRQANDGAALVQSAVRRVTGDEFAPDAAEGASALERARARVTQRGITASRAEIQQLEREFKSLVEQADRLAAVSGTEDRDAGTITPAIRRKREELETLRLVVDEFQKASDRERDAGTAILTRQAQIDQANRKAADEAAARVKGYKDGEKAAGQLEAALEVLEGRLASLRVQGDGTATLGGQLEALYAKVAKANAPAEKLAQLRDEIDAIVQQSNEEEIKKLGQQLEDLVVQSTITAVDDLALAAQRSAEAFEEMAARAERAKDPALADQVRAQAARTAEYNEQLIEVTKSLEAIAEARREASQLAGVGVGALGGADLGAITSALVERDALKEIDRLLATPKLDPQRRVQLEDDKRKITEQIEAARKRTADLDAQSTVQLEKGVGLARQWVDALTGAAAAVGGLNTNLVRSLSGFSQILSGVQGITEAARKAQGFSKLFSSGTGALAAASGVGAIVGGFSVIADAFDLFGTKSAERARQMREAAVAWGRALEDFVITTRSSLEDALQQNINRARDLVQQAAASVGANVSGFDFESPAELRQRITFLEQLGRANQLVASTLRPFLRELNELAEGIEQNEATLRAQNEARLVQASQDLEVRRLIAAGRTGDAEALRRQLVLQRELEAALLDTSDAGAAYAAALGELILQETAAAEAARVRAGILSTLEATLSVNGLTGRDALDAIVEAIGRIAPELAGLADGFDLSTRDGLEAFRAKLRDYFNAIASDGIDDVEAPLVQLIQRILGGIEGALGALPEALDPIAAALEAFDVRAEVFGLSAAQRLQTILPLLAQQFAGIGAAIEGIDPAAADGLTALRERLEGLVLEITRDGVIDAAEAPILNAIRQILGLITSTADEATRAAEEAARIAEETRQRTIDGVRRGLRGRVELDDLEGTAAVQAQLQAFAALSPALAGLLELDLSTLDGLERAKAILRDVFGQITAGTISAEQLGTLLGPELAEIILSLDGEFDGLIESLLGTEDAARRAAEELGDFSATVAEDFLRATGKGLEAELAAIDRRVRERVRKAQQLGASADVIRQIEAIGAAEREAAITRAAEAAARDALRLAEQLTQDAASTDAASSSRVTTRSVQSISEVTGQVVAGYLRSISVDTRQIASLLQRTLGGALPIVTPPAFVSSRTGTVAGGNTVLDLGGVTVNVQGAIAAANPQTLGDEIGRTVLLQISAGLGRLHGLYVSGNKR